MRRHEKASTAGSTQRQAKGLGRFFRGGLATRDGSLDSNGSGASSIGHFAAPLSLLAALVALMVAAAPVAAVETHPFKETLGSAAQPSLGGARGVAVDQSGGQVLVMDASGVPSIKRYNPDGTPAIFTATGTNVIDGQGTGDETPQNGLSFASAAESQLAVDNSGGATDGNIYVTQSSPNLINIFSDEGTYLGQLTAAGVTNFNEACGVAVDSSGAVYVGDYGGGIHKFVPAASPPVNADFTATFTTTSQPCTLAAGAGPTAGFLFAAQYNGPISKLDSSSGELKYVVAEGSNLTVSVDPVSGHVYTASGSSINEFDASGTGEATKTSSFSLSSGAQGVATNGASGNVYVTRSGSEKVEVFGPLVVVPEAITGSATNIEPTSATFNGNVNPDGIELTECLFEYGKSTSYGQSVLCAQSPAAIGSGSANVPVSANVSGLELGAVYHFRLIAKNANGESIGADVSFKLKSSPVIDTQWVQSTTSTEATLVAQINPENVPTTFHIDYGPTASYGQSTPAMTVASDQVSHTVRAILEGLQPKTTYHYRFVATNSIGISNGADQTFSTYAPFVPDTSCPNQAFRVGASAGLPDCRAYEMVSPVDKNGGDIKSPCTGLCYRAQLSQASTDGNKLTFSSYKAFAGAIGAPYVVQYLASRESEGWSTHSISPPRDGTVFSAPFGAWDFEKDFRAFTDDLSTSWLTNNNKKPLSADGINGFVNLYKRDNSTESYDAFPVGGFLRLEGRSKDGSHAVFSLDQKVYDLHNGTLHLVSVLPNGEPTTKDSVVGVTEYGATSAGAGEVGGSTLDHAVSDDGSHIFWTADSFSSFFGSPGELYVRIDNEETIRISSGEVYFRTASTDGSKVLFDTATGGSTGDLYEFDVDTETQRLIAGEASGVVGTSDDLSHIYFVSQEDLADGASPGESNIYLDQEGSITFVTTLAPKDVGIGAPTLIGATSAVSRRPQWRATRVTPDGNHVAFMSERSLTGYDNTDANTGEAVSEVFLYTADSNELVCASCRPNGSRPEGQQRRFPYTASDEEAWVPNKVGGWLATTEDSLHAPHPLSDDGNRLFFNSADALVPRDTNGQQDVYQWEAEGSGTCREPGGCIDLISSGQSPKKSEFIDADPVGENVFFETKSSLVPGDPGLIDIYVARVNGGFTPEAVGAASCEGDACQAPPPAPRDPTPASATYRGPGSARSASRQSCTREGKRSQAMTRLADRMLRNAKRIRDPHKAAPMFQQARRAAKNASRLSKRAKRCRHANRGAGR